MKKLVSLLLIVAMMCSLCVTTFATTDYTNGTQVKYIGTGAEEYTITVPAELKPGQSGTVTLSGIWATNRIVNVTADDTVTLTNSINANDQKVLDVTFNGITEAGSNTGVQTFTETVSVAAIQDALFGTWSGKFNYNVEVADGNIVAYSYNGEILPKIPVVSEDYPYAYVMKVTGDVLATELAKAGMAEYIGLVNVGYYVQYTTHPRWIGILGPEYVEEQQGMECLHFSQGKMLTYGYFVGLDDWTFVGSRDASIETSSWLLGDDCKLVWCNNDVLREDGSFYFAATEPVPVYE